MAVADATMAECLHAAYIYKLGATSVWCLTVHSSMVFEVLMRSAHACPLGVHTGTCGVGAHRGASEGSY